MCVRFDRRWMLSLIVVAAAVVMLLATLVDPALAAPAKGNNGATAGENLGKFLKDLATPLIGGVAAISAVVAIARHDFAMVIQLMLIVLVAGLFLVDTQQLVTWLTGVWSNII